MKNSASTKNSKISGHGDRGRFHAKAAALAGTLAVIAILAGAARTEAASEFEPVAVKGIQFEGVSGKSVSVEELLDQKVSFFVQTNKDGLIYRQPREGEATTEVRLGDIGKAKRTLLDIGALRAVATAASKGYQDRGIYAVRIDIMGKAVRHLREKDSDGILVISVTEGYVAKVKAVTKKAGKDGKEVRDSRSDRLAQRVQKTSPVQAGEPLNVPKIDEHVARLNRHPGRHVEAEVRPGQEVGQLELDYLIMEQKPWMVYAQLDNTGTENTTELRERFGFRHYNLTGNDDILSFDYVTGNFQEVNYLLASYDFRMPGSEVARLKAFGGWSNYEGTELGIFDTEFMGDSYQLGGEFRTTLVQRKRLFLDLLAGARYQHVSSDNVLAGTTGESGFVLPWVGLKLDGRGRYSHGSAGVTAELGVASEEKTALALLGRSNVEDVWGVIRFDLNMSTYLDPVFDGHFSGQPVHELYGAVRGQFAPGQQRLTPSFMYPAGGFYSVRGYPESIASGDTTVVASLEYRLHLLDLLRANNQAKRADWDLILRGFVDGGQAVYNDPLSFETDTTLISAGLGFDLRIMRNFQCRLDLGIPLQAVTNGSETVEEGEARLHFSISASF